MDDVHAPSVEAYRRYRAIVDYNDRSWWTPTDDVVARLDKLAADEPTWLRPYSTMCIVKGKDKTACAGFLALATSRHADTSDDVARSILELAARGASPAEELPVLEALPGMRKTGLEVTSFTQNLVFTGRHDDAVALLRPVYLAHPELYYGGNYAYVLRLAGRTEDADALVSDWAARAPESALALSELAVLEARRGHRDQSLAHLALRRRLIGEESDSWASLADAYIDGGDLATARRLVDQLLAGSREQRAHGRYRAGVIAVSEGRFGAARDTLERAALEQGGLGMNAESTQIFTALCALDELTGAPDRRRHLVQLRDAFAFDPAIAATVDYEIAMVDHEPGTACPDLEARLDTIPDAPARASARRRMIRAGVASKCATCREVLAAGTSVFEPSQRSLLVLARCAESDGQAAVARRAYESAIGIGPAWNEFSIVDSTLASARLAILLEAQHDHDGAVRIAARVLDRWRTAEVSIPEIAELVKITSPRSTPATP